MRLIHRIGWLCLIFFPLAGLFQGCELLIPKEIECPLTDHYACQLTMSLIYEQDQKIQIVGCQNNKIGFYNNFSTGRRNRGIDQWLNAQMKNYSC